MTLKLNPLFSDGLVLQAGRPIRIFGTGDGIATVTLDGASVSVTSQDGFWMAELSARPYGGPFAMEVALDGETTVVHDVYIGETVLFAGQSNMQFKLALPDMPFHIVQIADYDCRADDGWRAVQEAQSRACARIPGAFLVRCADICESNAIHPPTKSRLAARLVEALAASATSTP